jgi:hypothetical protein
MAFRARRSLQRQIFTEPPPIDPAIRAELIRGYREDVLKLQELLGRDLSSWLEEGVQDTATGD